MGVNELIILIYNFMTFSEIYWLLIFVFQKNLSSCTMTQNKLMKYTIVNKDETFDFFSLPDPSRIWLLQWLPCELDGLLRPDCTSYTNHCFNLFSLFSNYLCLVPLSAAL